MKELCIIRDDTKEDSCVSKSFQTFLSEIDITYDLIMMKRYQNLQNVSFIKLIDDIVKFLGKLQIL